MKNPLLWLLFFLFWLVLGWWLWSFFICPAPADACGQWDIEGINYKAENHIQFRKNSAVHLTGFSSTNEGVTAIANHLKQNKDRAIHITGFYDKNERNTNPLMNLGRARAENIKRWLTGNGVAGNQISTSSDTTSQCYKGDTLRRGAIVSFNSLKKDDARLAAIKNARQTPITLQFDKGSDTPNISQAQRTEFSDLFYYLDNNPNARLEIAGHTDNDGTVAQNMGLSQDRADDIKKYIATHGGLPEARMDAQGYGPNNPIAPNDTPENMAINRRVEVILK